MHTVYNVLSLHFDVIMLTKCDKIESPNNQTTFQFIMYKNKVWLEFKFIPGRSSCKISFNYVHK